MTAPATSAQRDGSSGRPSKLPTVSVIIPAYNCADYLGGAISSALCQTYAECEVVVVNDGSTDETGQIAAAYGSKLTVVDQPNKGLAAARNAGIERSRGELITLCDADDVLLPDHVATAVNELSRSAARTWVASPSMLLMSDGIVSREAEFYYGKPSPEEQLDAILSANFVPIFSTFHRDMFTELGGFDATMRRCEDWDFWLRALAHGWRLHYVDRHTSLYRITPGSLSSSIDAMALAHKAMLRKTINSDTFARLSSEQQQFLIARDAAPSFIASSYAGRAALQEGDFALARSLYAEASWANPWDKAAARRARALALIAPASPAWWARAVHSGTRHAVQLRHRLTN